MRGFPQRVTLCAACFIALVALACPKPGPAPVNPTPDADASQPIPAPPSCGVACGHYENVCPKSEVICDQTCPGAQALDPGYTPCLAAATACMNCDATARAGTAGGPAHPHGR